LELSTGSFQATEFAGNNAWQKIVEQIESFSPREILFPKDLAARITGLFPSNNDQPLFRDSHRSSAPSGPTATPVEGELNARDAGLLLSEHFKTQDLSGFGFQARDEAVRAAAFCLDYAKRTQKAAAEHISEISYFDSSEFMVLDAVTLRNLDLVDARSDNNKHTLLKVIDETITSMGGRLLRAWLVRPSIKRSEIQTRQSAVNELSDSILREKLRFLMKEVSDLERLVGRVNLGNASPRDLLALRRSIRQVPEINSHLADSRSLLLQVLAENMFDLPELADLIDRAIADEPPMNLADGGVIKDGFDPELDDLRQISRSGKQTIASFEESERQRSGIPTLKVRFNNVFGYYIEISKAQLARVPEDYERRQTLANAERYTTPQLKEWEQKVLGAEEKFVQLETELF